MNTTDEKRATVDEQAGRPTKADCSVGDCCAGTLASFQLAHSCHPHSLSRTLDLLPWLSADPAIGMHMGALSTSDQILSVPQTAGRARQVFYPPMAFSYQGTAAVPLSLPVSMPLSLPLLPPSSLSAPSAASVAITVASRRRSRGQKRPTPEDQKDQRYLERRRRNNTAAKKSRDARRAREDQIALRASILEHENAVLRAQLIALRSDSDNLRTIILSRRGEVSESLPSS